MNSFAASALFLLFASLSLGICLTWAILSAAARLPWLARSSSDRLHIAPTPVWGGVAIFVAFFSVAFGGGLFRDREMFAAALPATGIFLLGLVDDIWKLPPRWKLLVQLLSGGVILWFGVNHILTGNKVIDLLLSLLWIVGITNAFNLLDNINGLSAGTAVLASGFQAASFLSQGEPLRALASIAFAGAILGFLTFNFPKGAIFMGDSGSLFIGFWLAVTTLSGSQYSEKNYLGSILFPLLVMLVPICDTTLVTITRVLNGRPVSVGGTDHLSHRLMAYGFSQKSAVIALWFFSFLSGCIGLFALSYGLFPLLSAVIILVVAIALFGTYLTRFELQAQTNIPLMTTSYPGISVWVRISSRILLDSALIVASYYTAYLVRFEGRISKADMHLLLSTTAEMALVKTAVLIICGAYRPWWNYFGLRDAYRFVGISALSSLVAVTYFSTIYRFLGFSRIVIVLEFLIFTLLSLIFRFSFRLLDELCPSNHRTNVLIYGADSDGETVLQLVSKHYRFRVVGFLDDDRGKKAFSIHSVPIRGSTQDLVRLAERSDARAVLLTPSVKAETKNKLSALCQILGIRLLCLRLALEDLGMPATSSASQSSLKSEVLGAETAQHSPKILAKASSSS